MVSRNTWIAIIAAMVVSIVAEFFVHHHGDPPWYMIKGFYAGFGFVSCVIIIVVSKAIGHWFLDRDETYYDAEEGETESDQEVNHG